MALTQKQVSELYVAIFNRASEGEGNKFWQTSQTGAAAAKDMLATTDAKAYFGTSLDSNQAFIEHIYSNTLNKTYAQDKAGIDFWVNALNSGVSRGEVVASLVAAVANYSSSTDPVTKAAYDQFNNRVEVSNYMANTVEKAPANYATSTKFATTGLVVTNSASTVTAAKTSVDTMKPVPGQTFTLTTGADVLVMTTGDDTITGTVGTLNDNDIILDNSTTDNDVLNATITAASLKPTIKNIEKANLTWASNADMVFDAVNSTGNSFNVTANALAFSGNVAFNNLGTNNVAVDSKATGTLSLTNVVKSTVNAGAATAVTLTKGTSTVVGEKTSADITVNNNVTFTNTTAAGVENVTLRSTVEGAKVTGTAGASQIVDQLTVAGDKSITYNGVVTGEKIVNSLTAGKLTVESTDTAALNTSKINANLISLKGTAGASAVTVGNNQNFLFDNATAGALASFTAAAGVTNAVVNLETKANITSLNITGISTLNLDVKAATTIGTLVTDADNNVNITGDSKTTIGAMTGSTTVSIDASKLTGEFVVASTTANVATGIIGSSTAKNTISTAATTANVTVITGSADDTITAATTTGALTINAGDGKNTVDAKSVTTGTAKITTGSGNDTIDLSGLTTGKATVTSGSGDDKVTLGAAFTATTEFTFDGGAGTDTLVIGAVDLSLAKVFNLTSVEEMTITTGAKLAGSQLSGKAYAIKAAATGGTLNVDVVNPNAATAITTDLSGLNFSTSTTSNFSSVVINGIAGVADTIKATTMNDTITVGGTAKDTVDLTSGGADIITIANDASKYSTTADNMVSIKGFNAVASATAVDKLDFAAAAKAGTKSGVDVKAAITGNAGTESVLAGIDAKGILTISGIDSGKIDTIAEWMKVAELTVKDTISGAAGAAGDTLAFQFNGNTYVYNLKATGAVADDNIVELVGVTGITAVDAAAAADNTIFIG